MSELNCPWCIAEYGGGRPANFGSDPRCAFGEGGVFRSDNWQCAGLSPLRDDATMGELWNNDQNASLLRIGDDTGCFIVLSYYKHRGRTEGAWLVDQSEMRPLTIADVTKYLSLVGRP